MKKFGLLLSAFGLLFLVGCAQKPDVETVNETGSVAQAKVAQGQDLFLLVASHADEKSCWTIISGSVYDLTSWIGKHPGGDKAILASCGKDATEMFDNKHGMDPKKWEGLESFKVML